MTFKKENAIQLEQKIIHYRAEIVNYEQKIHQLERDLKREKVRNEYLQKELYDAENANIHTYEKEINRLKDELLGLEVALEEERKRNKAFQKIEEKVSEIAHVKNEIIAFFNYAFLLSDFKEDQKQITIFGDLHILNSGTEPLHDLLVCIRMKPKHAGQLSGKILTAKPQSSEQSPFESKPNEEWQFVQENWRKKIRETGEYWIKPTQMQEIKPVNQLSFTGFNLTLKQPSDQHSVIVEGFIYCKEIPKGTKVQNNIVVNF